MHANVIFSTEQRAAQADGKDMHDFSLKNEANQPNWNLCLMITIEEAMEESADH